MGEKQVAYRSLGISFMVLGASIALVFGLTMGWVFAPIGLSFAALGLIFLTIKGDDQ